MPDALIISGSGDHADEWHDFGATSGAVASILSEFGFSARVSTEMDASLRGLAPPDLLILNIGGARGGTLSTPARSALQGHIAVGGALLAFHSTAAAFADWGPWRELLGGRWVPEVSFHPEQAPAEVNIVPGHPIASGLLPFLVNDERYTDLEVDPGVTMIATHTHDGREHPLVWAHEPGGRVVYDALGHDAGSYESNGRRRLLEAEVRWLVGPAEERRGRAKKS